MSTNRIKTEVAVLGSGPGGYSAAFRAADLGKQVAMIERYPRLGGVCLNVGCIPSKALLHAAQIINEAKAMGAHGIEFGEPNIDLEKLLKWKTSVVNRLTGGLKTLARQRKVQVVQGTGRFISPHEYEVTDGDGQKQVVEFEETIIAAGSRVINLPFLPDDPRIMDSTGALELEDPKGELLVLGGGIIGLEMATVYDALGAKISVVEMLDQLIPAADKDVVAPLMKWIKPRYQSIMLETKVTAVEAKPDGLWVNFEGKNAPEGPQRYDRILSAVGRRPNGDLIDAAKAGVHVDERGFVPVDNQQRTNVGHIYAIGDICGNPMLAHKAVPEGHLAAEVIAGKKHYNDSNIIPSVAYTDPEVAWVGVTEKEAKEQGIEYEKGAFPWLASGRSLSIGRTEGLTKMIFEKETHRVIGAGIVGTNAGELIAEVALAIEMGCDAEDIALTSHPHPTLSETVMLATEMFEGTITDLYFPKKRR